MRRMRRLGYSVIVLAMGAIGSSSCWSGDFVQPQPLPAGTPETDLFYPGKPERQAMYRCNRLSWSDYQKDIRDYAEASRQLEVEARVHPWRSHFKAFHIGQSHQTIKQTAQRNREYVVQWFCYTKGNGMAVWDHRP